MTTSAYAPDIIRPVASWESHAACTAPDVDPDAWFPDAGDLIAATEAKQTCQACPVRELCLADALATEDGRGIDGRWGIRGGLNPAERFGRATGRRVRAGRAECGTDAAYRRHRKNHEPVCPACQEAHRAAGRAYKKTRAVQAKAVA